MLIPSLVGSATNQTAKMWFMPIPKIEQTEAKSQDRGNAHWEGKDLEGHYTFHL